VARTGLFHGREHLCSCLFLKLFMEEFSVADFMNVQDRWVSGHNRESSQTFVPIISKNSASVQQLLLRELELAA
jgi:hypothetical protein